MAFREVIGQHVIEFGLEGEAKAEAAIVRATLKTNEWDQQFKRLNQTTTGVYRLIAEDTVKVIKSTSDWHREADKVEKKLRQINEVRQKALSIKNPPMPSVPASLLGGSGAVGLGASLLNIPGVMRYAGRISGVGGAGYLAKEVVGQSIKRETSEAELAKTTGLGKGDIGELSAEISELSKRMRGVDADELMQIAIVAGQLGITGKKNISAFTESVAKMTVTSNMKAEEAANSFAKILNLFQKAPAEAEKLGAVMTKLADQSVATESELADMMTRMGAGGSTLGLTIPQIAAISATLKDVGVSSEVGGTAMSQFFGLMSLEAEEFAKVAKVTTGEWKKMVEDAPMEALQRFLGELSKLSKGDAIAAIKSVEVDGQRGAMSILGLSKATEKLNENLAEASKQWTTGAALSEQYAASADTAANAIKSAWNAIKELGVAVGKPALAPIAKGAEKVSSVAKAISDSVVGSYGAEGEERDSALVRTARRLGNKEAGAIEDRSQQLSKKGSSEIGAMDEIRKLEEKRDSAKGPKEELEITKQIVEKRKELLALTDQSEHAFTSRNELLKNEEARAQKVNEALRKQHDREGAVKGAIGAALSLDEEGNPRTVEKGKKKGQFVGNAEFLKGVFGDMPGKRSLAGAIAGRSLPAAIVAGMLSTQKAGAILDPARSAFESMQNKMAERLKKGFAGLGIDIDGMSHKQLSSAMKRRDKERENDTYNLAVQFDERKKSAMKYVDAPSTQFDVASNFARLQGAALMRPENDNDVLKKILEKNTASTEGLKAIEKAVKDGLLEWKDGRFVLK